MHLAARFAGVEYKPVTLQTQDEVKAHKEPLPTLRTKDGNINGSSAIARYHTHLTPIDIFAD